MKKTHILYSFFIIFCGVTMLAGCAIKNSDKNYQEALDEMQKGNFESAAKLFEDIPDNFKDTELFKATIRVIDLHNEKEWLDAIRIINTLCLAKLYELDTQRSRISTTRTKKLRDSLLKPLYTELNINENTIGLDNGSRLIYVTNDSDPDEISSISSTINSNDTYIIIKALKNLYVDLLTDCLFHYYYTEQVLLGNDITLLSEYPYDRRRYYYGGYYEEDGSFNDTDSKMVRMWSSLYGHCQTMVERSIIEQNLSEYYFKTDNSISPISVTGRGLYMNIIKSDNSETRGLKVIPPFYFAEKLEDIRYVLTIEETYNYVGFYRGIGGAFSTKATITLKDMVTGKICFTHEYKAESPGAIDAGSREGAVYGLLDLSEPIETKVLLILNKPR